jgi:hypothetical protein
MKNIFAYTATDYKIYPAYISLNKKDDDTLWIIVRSKDEHDKVAEIQLSPEQLEQFACEVMDFIGG